MSDFDLYEREIEELSRPTEKKEPTIELTLEEAKALRDRIDWLWQNSWGDLADLDKKLWTILQQRIEQAEGQCSKK